MANIKITDLSAIADPISTDVLPIVDVSADTTNKISIETLLKNAAAGTAALPAFAFDDDPDTGIYRTGADGLGFSTGGTGRLFIDSSGNIGVGTSSPSEELEVVGDIKFGSGSNTWLSSTNVLKSSNSQGAFLRAFVSTAANPTYAQVGDENTGVYFPAADTLGVTTGGTEKLRIDSSGRVGIGNPSPLSKLHISTSEYNSAARIENTDGTNGYGLFVKGGGSASGRWISTFQDAAGNTRFHILANGNVGIKTSSPAAALDVVGETLVQGRLQVTSATPELLLSVPSGGLDSRIHNDGSGNLIFGTGTNSSTPTERLRIDSSGTLQVGASAAVGNVLPNYGSTVYYPGTQITGTGYSDNNWVGISTFSTSTTASGGSFITLSKSNNPTINSHTAVNTTQFLGAISFAGSDGTAFKNAAHISCTSGSTVGTNQMSGKLIFSTNNGGLNSDEAMRIDENGKVGIGTSAPSSILHIKGGGPLIIENGPSSSFGVEEFLRVDNGGVVVDRALQGFELANGGSRSHAISHNLNITSDGSAYTYTQGNYSGSNLIEFENGQIKIYADEQVTSGSQDAITPTEVIRIDDDGAVDIKVNDLTVYGLTVGRGGGADLSNVAVGDNALAINTTGGSNTAIGKVALDNNTTGNYNVAVGAYALSTAQTPSSNTAVGNNALYSTNTGYENVAVGKDALKDNTTGYRNVGVGRQALFDLTTGVQNVSLGANALANTTVGNNNTALGYSALVSNVAGSSGVAIGYESQYYCNNTSTTYGNTNVSIGYRALKGSTTAANNTGVNNIAIGYESLLVNTSGGNNVAVGRNTLYSNTSGGSNTAFGHEALRDNTTGNYNVAIGFRALYDATADQNVAVGTDALRSTTTGYQCTAVGHRALYANETGNRNAAFGYVALEDVTTGSYNAAFGWGVGLQITTGSNNFAAGRQSLDHLTTGSSNIALGYYALSESVTGNHGIAIGYESQRYANDTASSFNNTNVSVGSYTLKGSSTPANNTGLNNTAIGYAAMRDNTSGIRNVALGTHALIVNTTGQNNTALGGFALDANTTGSNSVAVGYGALSAVTTAGGNTAVGVNAGIAIDTGTTNTCIGRAAGDNLTSGDNNTVIGFDADASSATVDNEITLGNSSIATLRCQVTSITSLSDARDKTNIQPLGAGLQFVNALNPVSFDWNMRDGAKVGVADTGFIAQELQEAQDVTGTVIPGLVYDNNPEKLEASYGKLLPTLVKAIQELSAENAELKARLEAAGI